MEPIEAEEGEAELTADESPSTCLLCLEPSEGKELSDTRDLVSCFVLLTTKSESKHFSSLPKKLFTEGLLDGFYCSACFNRLHELYSLQNKIKSLQQNLAKLEMEIETDLLTTYYQQGDSPGENDSKKVTELRRRFYKSKCWLC